VLTCFRVSQHVRVHQTTKSVLSAVDQFPGSFQFPPLVLRAGGPVPVDTGPVYRLQYAASSGWLRREAVWSSGLMALYVGSLLPAR
jgi:hypothetical protein